MRIEILYVPGCPNYQPTLDQVEAALISESVRAQVRSVPVNTAAEAKSLLFPGSPTVRVNGKDVERSAIVGGLTCRIYADGRGIPAEAVLRVAILEAKQKE